MPTTAARPAPVVASPPAPPRETVLEAAHIVKRYGDRAVLGGIQFDIHAGEFHAVMGRSGSGKSTIINIFAGLDRPDEGTVKVRGQDLTRLDGEDQSEFRLRNIGIVFQHFNLIPDLSVQENIALPLVLAHVSRGERSARAMELMKLFGLEPLAGQFPDTLSGGELQRVAVARALANRPAVVLADEPTANLDDENAVGVVKALETAAEAGAGVLVASHDQLVSDAARRRYRLVGGRLDLVR